MIKLLYFCCSQKKGGGVGGGVGSTPGSAGDDKWARGAVGLTQLGSPMLRTSPVSQPRRGLPLPIVVSP